ncbi:MAG: ATP-binding protein [Candidatus Binatia bacterium]
MDVTQVRRAQRALEIARRELERRVSERTAELAAAIAQLRSEIEQRRRMHVALQASEQRYRELVESINDAVFAINEQGQYTYVSPVIESIVGYAPSELIGQPHTFLLFPDDIENAVASFSGSEVTWPSRMRTKSGGERWVRAYSRWVRDAAGGPAELRGVITDVTEFRRAEDRVRTQQAELAHVQRVATVGAMTAQVAHEINQPLAAIVNFADGLALRMREDTIDRQAVQQVAALIASEGRRAAEVIRRVRDFVRKGVTQSEPSDINALVREIAVLFEAEARSQGVAMRLRLDARIATLNVDRIQIQQVLMNLLRNALDSLEEVHAGERLLTVVTRRDGTKAVRITVRDTGVGLPPGAAPRIFEPFFTTKPHGLGIGLPISRSIVEAHGGRLWAKSAAKPGVAFHVSLPISTG